MFCSPLNELEPFSTEEEALTKMLIHSDKGAVKGGGAPHTARLRSDPQKLLSPQCVRGEKEQKNVSLKRSNIMCCCNAEREPMERLGSRKAADNKQNTTTTFLGELIAVFYPSSLLKKFEKAIVFITCW